MVNRGKKTLKARLSPSSLLNFLVVTDQTRQLFFYPLRGGTGYIASKILERKKQYKCKHKTQIGIFLKINKSQFFYPRTYVLMLFF